MSVSVGHWVFVPAQKSLMYELGLLCSNNSLIWTLPCDVHLFSLVTKHYSSFDIFPTIKNVTKLFYHLQCLHEYVTGQILIMGLEASDCSGEVKYHQLDKACAMQGHWQYTAVTVWRMCSVYESCKIASEILRTNSRVLRNCFGYFQLLELSESQLCRIWINF